MFYDLNVPTNLHARNGDAVLWEAARLGYDVVAFATTVSGKLGPEHLPPPHLRRSKDVPPKGEDTPVHLRGGTVGQYVRLPDGEGVHDTAILRLERRQPTGGTLLQLTRVTLEVRSPDDLANLSSPILAQYDIVAVRPATEKLLQQCMQFEFDILSLDLSERLPFFIRRPQAHVAASKGVAFEISFAGALSDSTHRHCLISNAVALVRMLRGRNIVLTSAAASLLHLRGPYDVMNMALLFNLDLQQARDAVVATPAAVVQHACSRRSHKGLAYFAP
ncbi:hypothetical protein MMPV_000196 [Pyropia vietnamensis]